MSHQENRRPYDECLNEIRATIDGEPDWVANLANTAAILFLKLPFSWVGFYRVAGDEMVLGPFQGPPACVRVGRGRGVCGSAWENDRTERVPDVHAFSGHIACDPRSRSEVVVPIHGTDGSVWGVLDVDSREIDDFSEADAEALESVVRLLEEKIGPSLSASI